MTNSFRFKSSLKAFSSQLSAARKAAIDWGLTLGRIISLESKRSDDFEAELLAFLRYNYRFDHRFGTFVHRTSSRRASLGDIAVVQRPSDGFPVLVGLPSKFGAPTPKRCAWLWHHGKLPAAQRHIRFKDSNFLNLRMDNMYMLPAKTFKGEGKPLPDKSFD